MIISIGVTYSYSAVEGLCGRNKGLHGLNEGLRGLNEGLRGLNEGLRGLNEGLRGQNVLTLIDYATYVVCSTNDPICDTLLHVMPMNSY